ncbi:MAG: YDG domain-containing protein, partial [Treponema sp.]|nr:YDG domain-containing protein [Treponema sp.]
TKQVSGITIKTAPPMTYTHGDPLNLAGMVVTLSYTEFDDEDVAFAQFGANNIVVSIDGTTVTNATNLIRTSHNGKPLTVTVSGVTPRDTATNLTINQRALTVTGVTHTRQYNGTNETTGATGAATDVTVPSTAIGNVFGSDVVTVTVGSGTYNNVNAITTPQTMNITGVAISGGAAASNYTIAGSFSNVPVTGGITRADGAVVGTPAINPTGARTRTSITVNAVSAPSTGQTVQYARSSTTTAPTDEASWQSGTAFSGLTAGTRYYIFARSAQSAVNFNAGTPSAPLEVWTLPSDDNNFNFNITYDVNQLKPGETVTYPDTVIINWGEATSTVPITINGLSGTYAWYILSKQPTAVGTSSSYTLNGSNFSRTDTGNHTLLLEVVVGGVPYNLNIPFRVQ